MEEVNNLPEVIPRELQAWDSNLGFLTPNSLRFHTVPNALSPGAGPNSQGERPQPCTLGLSLEWRWSSAVP